MKVLSRISKLKTITVLFFVISCGLVGAGQAEAQFCNPDGSNPNLQASGGVASGVSSANASREWNTTWFDDFNSFDSQKWSTLEALTIESSQGINVPSKVQTPGDGKLHLDTEWNQTTGVHLGSQITTKPGWQSYSFWPVPDNHPLAYKREGGTRSAQNGFSFKYGRVEVCMKAARYWNGSQWTAGGLHPAVWLLSTDGVWPPEIDIMESYQGLPHVAQAIHFGEYEWSWATNSYVKGSRGAHRWDIDVAGQYNLYAVEWSDTEIRFFINGMPTATYDSSVLGWGYDDGRVVNPISFWNSRSGAYLVLDNTVSESGGVLATTSGTAEALVDWIKVYYSPSPSNTWSDWMTCAYEHGTCWFSGTQQVRFGETIFQHERALPNGTACETSVFGNPTNDPDSRIRKCEVRLALTAPATVQTESDFIVTFANVVDPLGDDWLALYKHGQTGYSAWKYSGTCDSNTGNARSNGSCSFAVPDTATYEVKLYRGGTLLGTSNTFTAVAGNSGGPSWTHCAIEGRICSFTGTMEVRYGANGAYVYRTLTDSTACTNAVFGDPIYGVVKTCQVADAVTSPEKRQQSERHHSDSLRSSNEARHSSPRTR